MLFSHCLVTRNLPPGKEMGKQSENESLVWTLILKFAQKIQETPKVTIPYAKFCYVFVFFSICVLIPCSKEALCYSTFFLLIKNSATCLVLIKWAI